MVGLYFDSERLSDSKMALFTSAGDLRSTLEESLVESKMSSSDSSDSDSES